MQVTRAAWQCWSCTSKVQEESASQLPGKNPQYAQLCMQHLLSEAVSLKMLSLLEECSPALVLPYMGFHFYACFAGTLQHEASAVILLASLPAYCVDRCAFLQMQYISERALLLCRAQRSGCSCIPAGFERRAFGEECCANNKLGAAHGVPHSWVISSSWEKLPPPVYQLGLDSRVGRAMRCQGPVGVFLTLEEQGRQSEVGAGCAKNRHAYTAGCCLSPHHDMYTYVSTDL